MTRPALVLVSALSLVATGCVGLLVGAGAGVGTYAFIEGSLKRNYAAPVPRVWAATQAAVGDLQLKPATEEHDAFGGQLKGKLADGRDFLIKLSKVSDNETEVGVRIELLGDRKVSESIHDQIAQHLR